MPFDQKRINGPENSFSYKLYVQEKEKDEEAMETDNQKSRSDQRSNEEIRRIGLQMSVISKAKGSCYIELGETKVIVGVFELREIPRQNKYADKGQLYCDFKYSPFAKTNRKSVSENEEKLMATCIKSALEPAVCLHEFPNYQMDVFVNVLEDDGSVLAASIIAAGIAFADASIPMYDLIAASSVGVLHDSIIVDTTAQEESQIKYTTNSGGMLTVSTLSHLEQISQILGDGYWGQKQLKEAKKKATETNRQILPYIKKVISQKLQKNLVEK